MNVMMTWTRPILKRFKEATTKAEREHTDIFTFDGHEFVVAYAKHLIQYLEDVL